MYLKTEDMRQTMANLSADQILDKWETPHFNWWNYTCHASAHALPHVMLPTAHTSEGLCLEKGL